MVSLGLTAVKVSLHFVWSGVNLSKRVHMGGRRRCRSACGQMFHRMGPLDSVLSYKKLMMKKLFYVSIKYLTAFILCET